MCPMSRDTFVKDSAQVTQFEGNMTSGVPFGDMEVILKMKLAWIHFVLSKTTTEITVVAKVLFLVELSYSISKIFL